MRASRTPQLLPSPLLPRFQSPPLTSSSLFNVLEAKAEVMPAFRDWTNDCSKKAASECRPHKGSRSTWTGGLGQKEAWGGEFPTPLGWDLGDSH